MLSLLVLITGVVLANAGISHPPNTGLGLHYLASPPRQVLIRSELANPIGYNPTLQSHGLTFTKTFFPSPMLFNSAPFRHGELGLTSLQTTPNLHPAFVRYGAIGPGTITHISPPVVLKTTSIGSFPTSSLQSQGVFNSAYLGPGPIPLPLFSPSPNLHAAIKSGFTNTHPANNYKINNGVQATRNVPEKTVSYSITKKDYENLHRHKVEGKDSPYNPIPGFNTASPSEKLQHSNPHSSNTKAEGGFSHKLPDSDNVLKRSLAPCEAYHDFAEQNFENKPEPALVFKDIYFHVPPPEFNEPSPASINLPPPKKTYNIMFIKAPTQEQHNSVYLQQALNRQHQIEDKTLIYVLSKKEDPVQVIPSILQKPLSPEVFFVKYQTKLGDIADIENKVVEEFPDNTSAYSQTRSLEDTNHKETTASQHSRLYT